MSNILLDESGNSLLDESGNVLGDESYVAGTTVAANAEALTLTTQQASIALDVNVSANAEALTLTTYGAVVSSDVNVSANAEALQIATFAASVAHDVEVLASVEALTLTPQTATISFGVNVNASVEALSLTTYAASVALDVNISAAAESLSLTTYVADVSAAVNVEVSANAEALTITTHQATIAAPVLNRDTQQRGDDAPGMFRSSGESRRFFYEQQIAELEEVAQEIAQDPQPVRTARKKLRAVIRPLEHIEPVAEVVASVPAKDDGKAERDAFLMEVAAYIQAVREEQKRVQRKRNNDAIALLLVA